MAPKNLSGGCWGLKEIESKVAGTRREHQRKTRRRKTRGNMAVYSLARYKIWGALNPGEQTMEEKTDVGAGCL